jgi:hypothetical protein
MIAHSVARRARPIDDLAWQMELDTATWLDALPLAGGRRAIARTGWWSPLLAGKGAMVL